MIFLLEQALRSTITGLNFIEKYGGIVRPISRVGEGEEGRQYIDTFPVSCYINVANCFDEGRERDLIPDEQFSSVAYWEQRGGATIEPGGPNGDFWNVSQSMRFVCWLNFLKLGLTNCNATDVLELYLIERVHDTNGSTYDIAGQKFRLDVTRFRPVERSPRQVFGPYSYSANEWAFNWPYGFFAVDFEFRASLAAGCIVEPTLGAEIICNTTW